MYSFNKMKRWLIISAMAVISPFFSSAMAQTPGTNTDGLPLTTPQLGSVVPLVTETGFISLSVDGSGSNQASAIMQVKKPVGATVRAAYMAAASRGFSGRVLADGDVTIDGAGVVWNIIATTPSSISSHNSFADVTSLVKPKIDSAPAGLVDFVITEVGTLDIDGEILAVIFDDPNQTTSNTIILLFGAQDVTGDVFAIGLAEPIDISDPNLALDLSLGISFGFQTPAVTNQVSLVDVNGTRITSAAGGQDDGEPANGALLTVGGFNDSNANPADPFAPPTNFDSDDELYNLIPFVQNGDMNITVNTINPSNDDNIFFAGLFLASTTAIVGEGILLAPLMAINDVGTDHTVTATVQDDNGAPISGRQVTFEIVSGPHVGLTGTDNTDASGKATFTYTGTATGTDIIEARMVNSQGNLVTSNSVEKIWTSSTNQPPTADAGKDQNEVCTSTGSVTLDGSGSSDPDGDALTYTWREGANIIATGVNPTVSLSFGTHTIELTVDDGKGGTDTDEVVVTVFSLVKADFTADVTIGTSPLTVQFTNLSTGPIGEYQWEFGDGTFSTERNPKHTYTAECVDPQFRVRLIVAGRCGQDMVVKEKFITVFPPLGCSFFATPTGGAAPLRVGFTNNLTENITSYFWQFGDGATSTEFQPVHTYTENGVYDVSVTVQTNVGPATVTRKAYINVQPAFVSPAPALVLNGPDFAVKSGGAEAPAGWHLWSNDYVAHEVTNEGDSRWFVFTVVAAGSFAKDEWSKMQLLVDDVPIATKNINNRSPRTYEFAAKLSSGKHVVKLALTNFAVNQTTGNNRGLFITQMLMFDSATPLPAPPRLKAEAMTIKSNGTAMADSSWALYSNGYLGQGLAVAASGKYELQVKASGQAANGVNPKMVVFVNGLAQDTVTVAAGRAQDYEFPVTLAAGNHLVQIEYINNAVAPGSKENRDLIVHELALNRKTAPVAATADVTTGKAPLTTQFTSKSNLEIVSHHWNFGDGNESREPNPRHTYLRPGNFLAVLTATDKAGGVNRDSLRIIVNPLTTSVDGTELKAPDSFVLNGNYPNPFNPSTKIKFGVPEASQVRLSVYNLNGQEVARLVDSELAAGEYEREWNAANQVSGIYFARLTAVVKATGRQVSFVQKMSLAK